MSAAESRAGTPQTADRGTRAMTGDVETLAEWLTANTVTWSLEVNGNRGFYDPREDYLRSIDEDEADIPELLTYPDLYEARAYPSTPVGFVRVFGPTAIDALTNLRNAVEPTP